MNCTKNGKTYFVLSQILAHYESKHIKELDPHLILNFFNKKGHNSKMQNKGRKQTKLSLKSSTVGLSHSFNLIFLLDRIAVG